MRRELMEQKMNRPELLTRRPDPTSPSSRRRRALLRVILLPLEIVESADQVPVPAVDEVAPFCRRASAPQPPPETTDRTHSCWRSDTSSTAASLR